MLAPRSANFVRTRLYRAGGVDKLHTFTEALENDAAAEAEKPDDRVGRLDGIFCVASLPEVAMWSRSNCWAGPAYDPEPRELFYDGPEPYVYPAGCWHKACLAAERGRPQPYHTEYWSKGMRLSEYRNAHQQGALGAEWEDLGGEILIDPRCLSSHRSVSLKRLVEAAPDRYKDVEKALKDWRRRH